MIFIIKKIRVATKWCYENKYTALEEKEEDQECHPSEIYIGQKTTFFKQRMTTHAQNGSIKNHNHDKHQRRLRASEILLDVEDYTQHRTAKNLCWLKPC